MKKAHKTVPIDSIKPYPGNARRGNLERVQASLREYGQYRTIVVQKSTGFVLAGNHTWLGMKAENFDKADITEIDCDDATARQIVLVDNKSGDDSTYDNEALAKLLGDMEGDFGATGWDQPDLDKLLDSLSTQGERADKVPLGALAPRVQDGDVWRLGQHRLVCGSALANNDLAVLMDGEVADVIVTSPPYNQNLDGFKASGMQKENPAWVERMADAYDDSLPEGEYQDQQRELLCRMAEISRRGASFFYNHKVRYREKAILHPFEWLPFINGGPTDWRVRQEIIWDRMGSITLNARMLMPQDERIYWMTLGDDFTWNEDREVKAWGTVWQIAPRVDVQISAPFPVEIPMRCIRVTSQRGDIVVDPYGGSGTTLIAAEQLDRRAFLMELNPKYCDVILSRWEAFTEQQAERET